MNLYEPISVNVEYLFLTYRFLLIPPHLREHNFHLQHFVNLLDNPCYFSLTNRVESLSQFLDNLAPILYAQNQSVTALSQALAEDEQSPERLAQALLSDLGQTRSLHWLILDNMDLATLDNSFARFFECLVQDSSYRLTMIINGRHLDENFWNPFLQAGYAAVLDRDMQPSAELLSPTLPHLEVNAFGSGSIYRNGLPITDWDGPLVLNLFFYLIDRSMVTRDEIFETFWPFLSKKEATNVFHVTKRKLTQCLDCEITTFDSGFYSHTKGISLTYDVATFEAIARQSDRSEDTLKRGIAIHRNAYLYGIDLPWIRTRREELHRQYVAMLLELARLYRTQGKLDLALTYFGRARQQAPEREDIVRDLMALYAETGQPEQADHVYQTLRRLLQTNLKIQPSASTIRVYETIKPRV